MPAEEKGMHNHSRGEYLSALVSIYYQLVALGHLIKVRATRGLR